MPGDPIEEGEYAGHPAIRLDVGRVRAYVATGFGPRVIGLEAQDSGNLLAVVPDAWLPTGDGARYRFRGGHRLWVAPEVPAVTYRPDDEPVETSSLDGGGLRVAGARDPVTGLQRTIELRAVDDGLELRHVVANDGSAARRMAPWALTQLPVGGTAWLPLFAVLDAGPETLLPDRQLVVWPYTDVGDPRLALGNRAVELRAVERDPERQRIKVGSAGALGRLAYLRDGWLFEKTFEVSGGDHVDFGAAAQVYLDERFIELETLGPLVEVPPGGEAVHVERWHVRRASEDEVRSSFGPG